MTAVEIDAGGDGPVPSVCVEMVFDGPFVDRFDRAASAGAPAVEFWGWRGKDLDALRSRADDLGVEVAAMGGTGEADLTDPGTTEQAVAEMRESIERADEYGVPALIVTVGPDQEGVSRGDQEDAIVEALSGAAPAAEDHGVTLAVEPLNAAVDHPGYYLTHTAQAVRILDAVDSPRVGLLYDVYHQQITEGNVIDTIRTNADRLAHVHVADVPGRHEPGTGELAYERVLAALADTGYRGYVGCEFRPTGDPEAAVRDVVGML